MSFSPPPFGSRGVRNRSLRFRASSRSLGNKEFDEEEGEGLDLRRRLHANARISVQTLSLGDKVQVSAKEWSLGCVKRAPKARGGQKAENHAT